LSGCSTDRFDKLRGQGRHAGKPLDKIQRDALRAQNGASRAGDFQQRRAGFNVPTVANATLNPDFGGTSSTSPKFNNSRSWGLVKLVPPKILGRDFAKGDFGKIETGDDERFARAHDGFGHRVCWNCGQRGRVAAADVLGERGPDGLADFFGGQFHADKMTAGAKRKSKKALI
jgi:hypothetical protein